MIAAGNSNSTYASHNSGTAGELASRVKVIGGRPAALVGARAEIGAPFGEQLGHRFVVGVAHLGQVGRDRLAPFLLGSRLSMLPRLE